MTEFHLLIRLDERLNALSLPFASNEKAVAGARKIAATLRELYNVGASYVAVSDIWSGSSGQLGAWIIEFREPLKWAPVGTPLYETFTGDDQPLPWAARSGSYRRAPQTA